MKKMCAALIAWCLMCSGGCSLGAKERSASETGITAITEVYGDGQKLSAIAIEYPAAIDTAKLRPSNYAVEGKKITSVYANTSASKAAAGVDGRFVLIELENRIVPEAGMPSGPMQSPGPPQGNQPTGFAGPKMGEKSDKPATGVVLTATLKQITKIYDAGGKTIPAWVSSRTSTKTVNLIVDDFRQYVYTDPLYPDAPLMYNLYVPRDYDSKKKYPLVLFIHDAGAVSNNVKETLTQGLGAVVWAKPEEQAKHACFVLAPQFDRVIVDDSSTASSQMDVTIDLIKKVMKEYSIDGNRLYNTGQSMGGMVSIAMDIKYPEFFAASLLVACQWNPSLVAPLAKKPLWIIVSQGDNRAKPGQDAITSVLIKQGATVSEAIWDAQANSTELANAVAAMLAKKADIQYTVFLNGNHRYTWQYAYSIEGVRDWLFMQSKGSVSSGKKKGRSWVPVVYNHGFQASGKDYGRN